MDTFISIFAGLGLFFIGVKLIGGNLKQMAGRRFRALIARAVANPVAAAALGTSAGALTQSTNAVTFITINTVTAGLIRPRDALPVMIWSNVGTSALVLLATLDVHLLVLFLIGCVGVLYYLELDKSARLRHVTGALLGVGLLFLGVDFIHVGADGLKRMESVAVAIDYARNSFVLVFLVGVVVTVIAQSSATVTVVAVAMINAGLLTIDQTIFIVYGAGVGSGIGVWLMAGKLTGTPRQLAAVQVVTKFVGALVLVPLCALELSTGWPLVKALSGALSPNVDMQPAWIYFVYQIVSVGLVMAVLGPIFALVRKIYPQTLEEDLSKPRYVSTSGATEAETGLLLVQKEHQRLVTYLRDSLDAIREDAAARRADLPRPDLLHRAGRSVGGEVGAFLTELMEETPQRDTMERLSRLYAGQELLDELADEVHGLVTHLAAHPVRNPSLQSTMASMVESLHLIVTVLEDELQAPDPFQRATLVATTSDRSEMMDRLRRELTRGDQALGKAEQETLFAVTTHFEHAIWLVRRYLSLVGASEADAR